MKIAIVRHGETTWNEKKLVQGQADPPLNKSGISQAIQLANELKPKLDSFEVIYTSELQRALQTAEIIRGKSDIPLLEDRRLNSRNLGLFSGLTLKQIEEKYPELYVKWINGDETFRPPNGESTKEMNARLRSFFNDLIENHDNSDNILIVTHRENLGYLAWLITGKKFVDPLKKVENCKVYEFELDISKIKSK